ncbi:amidohydrolase family protein [Nocardioides mangrovi]|uniref:Amidohydrolase family protein n=1 Tax=Nocardioides mangrovi TaxID=2874580 RepID=A0ABS7UF22_9ACTN|nr:amidohydrolase family protein [Nocardioides mangrovi]MBZ5739615.1 amidohydrolase family protein [Nocardioides mangrovi]
MRLTHARTLGHDQLVDLRIADGRIVEISPATGAAAPGDLDVAGRLVLPGLVETHLHLDKAHLDDLAPNPDGTLAGAIAVTGRLKADFAAEGIAARARRVLEAAIANGTTLVRAHPDVDPIVGTLGVEVLADLRAEYAGRIDLQIVAFPQEGVIQAPGTLRLLERAVRHGADVIGGCTYNEADRADSERQVGLLLDLAERHGLPLDLHADFGDDPGDPRFAMAGAIAAAVRERGLEGRVSLGHMTALGSLERDALDRTLGELAAADVAVVLLPHTDLHLGGRADTSRVRRGLAPLHALWAAGVRASYSSNNVRNAFTPFGNADLLETGLFLAQVAHLGSPDDLARVVDMATTEAARIAGIDASYGLRPGAAADLVVLDATDPVAALLDRAPRRWVLKRGRVVAETTRSTALHDPSTGTTLHERTSA